MASRLRRLAAFLALALLARAPARADSVVLADSVTIRGIAGKVEDGMLKVQVDLEGYVYYPIEQVVEVKKEGAKRNAELLESWRKAKQAAGEDKDKAGSREEVPCWLAGPYGPQSRTTTAESCRALQRQAAVNRAREENSAPPATYSNPGVTTPQPEIRMGGGGGRGRSYLR